MISEFNFFSEFNFLLKNKMLSFNDQITLAQKVKVKRPFYIVIKQRFF